MENPEMKMTDLDKDQYASDVEDANRVGGIIDNLSADIKEVLQDNFVKKGVYRILDKVDENYMDTMRAIWAKTPDEVKWAIMYMPALFKGNPALLHLLPLHVLIKTGLLDYPEESIQYSAELEKKVLEYGVKFGKYLDPAIAVLEPLIKPIQKIWDMEEAFFEGMRAHLKNKKGQGNKYDDLEMSA